jgi:hypothetical protein
VSAATPRRERGRGAEDRHIQRQPPAEVWMLHLRARCDALGASRRNATVVVLQRDR